MSRQLVPYQPKPEPALVGEIVIERPYFKVPSGKRGEKLAKAIMSAPGLASALMQLHLADEAMLRKRDPHNHREAAIDILCMMMRDAREVSRG